MKIKIKIPIIIFSIVLIIGLVITIVSQTILRNIVQQQVFRHLETTAQSRVAHIEPFLDIQKKSTLQLSESIVIERLLISNRTDKDYNDRLNDVITRFKNSASINEEIYDIFVTDTNGVIIASNIEERHGLDRSDDPCFIYGKKGVYIKDAYFSRFFMEQPSLAFSAPVFEDVTNNLLGVVVIRIKLYPLNDIMTYRTGLGETGEIYLLNKDGYMITPSRFIDNTFLKQKVETENARNCFKDVEQFGSEKHEYRAILCENYLGKSVLGIHAHIPETGWCLLAEMSEKEAFASIIKLTHTRILILTVFLVGGIILSIILSRTITKPIVELRQGTEEIMRGNLDYRVGTKSRDEIGQLSRAFDEMTVNLKKSRDKLEEYSKGLERKVEERTTEIAKSNKQLKKKIAEHKKAEEAQRELETRYRSLFEGVPVGIYKTSPKGELIDVNPALRDMLGYPDKDTLLKVNVFDIHVNIEDRKRWQSLIKSEKVVRDFEMQLRRYDGQTIWVRDNAQVVKDSKGKVLYYEGSLEDITKTKKAAEELHQYTVELEESNQELDAFSHTVAHDLKNPLNNIFSFAQVLEKAHTTMTNEKLQHYLHTITQNGSRMRNIIDELFLLSKVRKLEMDLVPLDMASIVSSAQQRLVYMIEQYKAEVILTDTWPKSLGYGPWVEEVWVNYISNAIKYGGSPPRVELGATVQLDGNIRFWVRDNGSGVSPEEKKRLFTPFTRLSQIRVEGYGLGLSIVRRIVEKIGGQVGMESKIGTGSTFWFTLQKE